MATKSKTVVKKNPMLDAWIQTRDGLRNLVSGLGTRIDKSYSTQYTLVPMSDDQLIAAYRSDWIVRKAVDIPALDAVREWRIWQANDKQIQALTDTENRLMLRPRVRDCLIRARLFGGAVLILGVGKQDPATELVPEKVKKDELNFVHVMSRSEITVGPINLNPMDKFYGEPEYYELNSDNKGLVRVHPSRVVRLIGNPTPLLSLGNAWGDSILYSIDDAVKQAGTAAQSLVALIQEAKTDIVKIPDLMNNLSTAEYEQKLLDRFSLAGTARSIVNTYILDSEEEWQRSTTNFSALPEAVRLFLQIVSGAADIPATRMLGQSPGGIVASGDTDTRNYYDRVSSEQENTLRPALLRLDETLIRSALGDRPDEVYYDWAPLWQMDEGEKAKMVLAKAQALQIHHNTGLLDPHSLSEGFINQLIADNVYPGLSITIEDNKGAPALNEDPAQMALLAQLKGQAGSPAGKGGVVPPTNPPSQNPAMVAKQKAVAQGDRRVVPFDYNECHNPPGPGGGQFCNTGEGKAAVTWEKVREKLKRGNVVVKDTPNSVRVEANGDGIVRFDMRYNEPRNELEIYWTEVENTDEGHAAARDMFDTIYGTAMESGAQSIALQAGLESGGYVWAKLGFEPDSPDLLGDEVLERVYGGADLDLPTKKLVNDIVSKNGPGMATTLANLDQPISKTLFDSIVGHPAVSEWAAQRQTKLTLGKALLAGTDYDASLPRDKFGNLKAWADRVRPVTLATGADVTHDAKDTLSLADVLLEVMDEFGVLDYNECHEPAGSEKGGQFCSGGGGASPLYEKNLEKYPTPTEEEFLNSLTPEQRAMIEDAENLLAAGTPTNGPVELGGFMQADGTYTAERQELHAQILSEIFSEEAVNAATPAPGEDPTAILLGGRSGSGKTTALKAGGVPYDQNSFIVLNADDIQLKLPGYRGDIAGLFNGEAQDIVAQAELIARTSGLNYVYDATLKSTAPALARMQELKNAGYRVEGYFVHTTPAVSARRVVERFERNGRYVPPKIPLTSTTNEKSFDTIKPAFAKYKIYDNNTETPVVIEEGGTELSAGLPVQGKAGALAGSLLPVKGKEGAPVL